MNYLLVTLRVGWITWIIWAVGMLLLGTLLAAALRRSRALHRVLQPLMDGDPLHQREISDPPPSVSAWPLLFTSMILLVLPGWSSLTLHNTFERVIQAFIGIDPSSLAVKLSLTPRPDIPMILSLCCGLLFLQLLLAAPVIGLTLACRSRSRGLQRVLLLQRRGNLNPAAQQEVAALLRYPGLSPIRTAGFCLGVVLLIAAPLALGVIHSFARWNELFIAAANVAPDQKSEMVLSFLDIPRSILERYVWVSRLGVGFSCVAAFLVFAVWTPARARRALAPGLVDTPGPSTRTTLVSVITCLLLAAALYVMGRPFQFKPPLPPPDGPVARLIAATGKPLDWVQRLRATLALPALKPLRDAIPVTITTDAILVYHEQAAAVRRGVVASAAKADGASGYLITPLIERLRAHEERVRRIHQIQDRPTTEPGVLWLSVDRVTPFRLLTEVLTSAGQAGINSIYLWSFEEREIQRAWPPPAGDEEFTAWKRNISRPPIRLPHYEPVDLDALVRSRATERRARLARQVARMSALRVGSATDRDEHTAEEPAPATGGTMNRTPPPRPEPNRAATDPLMLTISIGYQGFNLSNKEGALPPIKCRVPLQAGRCPSFYLPEDQDGFKRLAGENDYEAYLRWRNTLNLRWRNTLNQDHPNMAPPSFNADGYDDHALQRQVKEQKTRYPGARQVIISAAPQIPARIVLRVMDLITGAPTKACTGEDGCYFDRVIIAADVQ